jgi:hypothetical protein
MGKGGEIIIAVGLGDPFFGIWDEGSYGVAENVSTYLR